MCHEPRCSKLVLVSNRTVQISISASTDGDEIRGQIGESAGQSEPFCGWLGLISALDGLLGRPVSDVADRCEPANGWRQKAR
jgi:hypothetical protein